MPHSDISGSILECRSPELFAAYNVLIRLLMPRHPSCALSSLTTKKQINFVLQSLNISCLSNCKFLCNPSSCRLLTNLFFSCQSTPRSLADFSLNNQVNLYLRVKLVGVLGFEPRTSSLSGTRSNQLSYTPLFPKKLPPFAHGARDF